MEDQTTNMNLLCWVSLLLLANQQLSSELHMSTLGKRPTKSKGKVKLTEEEMKYKYQRLDYHPILRSTLPNIGDTILGSVCLQYFWLSLVNKKRTPLAKKILESGLARAGRNPISTQCLDLVLECMKAYQPNTREFISLNNKVIVHLDPISIAIAF